MRGFTGRIRGKRHWTGRSGTGSRALWRSMSLDGSCALARSTVAASSSSVYGNAAVPFRETRMGSARSIYAATKQVSPPPPGAATPRARPQPTTREGGGGGCSSKGTMPGTRCGVSHLGMRQPLPCVDASDVGEGTLRAPHGPGTTASQGGRTRQRGGTPRGRLSVHAHPTFLCL